MKTILVDAVNTFVVKTDKGFKINDSIRVLLDGFAQRKIILTNADDAQMINFGLDKMPYEVFTLKHDPDKPNPVYFETMLRKYGLNASQCVYFEHNPEAVKSAETAGITTYLYNHNVKDISALEVFLRQHID